MQRSVVPVLIAILLAAPVGASTWSINGAFEPDTPQDLSQGRMFLEPDTNPGGMKVYFNAMAIDRNGDPTGLGGTFNPNVGALQTRVLPVGQMSATAWLGIWKDCNADGYIGMAESAVLEYKNELLLDKTICPENSMWNHHTWVSEFIHIGPEGQPPNSASFPRLFTDLEADVWGDFGRPDGGEVHYDCLQAPFPQGTFDSTGGLLVYVDCQIGYNIAKNINAADEQLGLGIGFDDPVHPERDCDSPLNQQFDTFGNSWCDGGNAGLIDGNASDPLFTVWDCSGGEAPGYLVDVRDPTAPPGETGSLSQVGGIWLTDNNGTYGVRPIEGDENSGIYLRVSNVAGTAPSLGNPDGSLYEGYQYANDPQCDTENHSNNGPQEGLLGADIAPATNPTDGKRVADFNLGFDVDWGIAGAVNQAMPYNAGVRGVGTGPWTTGLTYLPPTYLGGTIRNEDLMPAGGIYMTFYASIGAATLARGVELPGSIGFYGSEACGSNDSGIHNSWDCDVEHWGGQAVLGAIYHLRDNDCYDGELLGGSGIYASLAYVSDDPPCPFVA